MRPDVIDGRPGAVLAEARTPEALATAIEEALTSDDLRRGADEGRAQVIADYGAERHIPLMPLGAQITRVPNLLDGQPPSRAYRIRLSLGQWTGGRRFSS